MTDDIMKKTADDFRLLTGQPVQSKPAPLEPAESYPPQRSSASPSANTPYTGEASRVRQALEETVEAAITKAMAENRGAGGTDGEMIVRLDELSARLTQRDADLTLELRNVLPGRIRQELHEQLRLTNDRLNTLEATLATRSSGPGWLARLASAIVFAVVAGLIMAAAIIFERPLRNWGQDNLFPLVGVSIGEAQKVRPSERRAPPLGDR